MSGDNLNYIAESLRNELILEQGLQSTLQLDMTAPSTSSMAYLKITTNTTTTSAPIMTTNTSVSIMTTTTSAPIITTTTTTPIITACQHSTCQQSTCQHSTYKSTTDTPTASSKSIEISETTTSNAAKKDLPKCDYSIIKNRLNAFTKLASSNLQFKPIGSITWKKLSKCGFYPMYNCQNNNFIFVKCFSCNFKTKIYPSNLNIQQLYSIHLVYPCPYVKSLQSTKSDNLSVPDIPLARRFIHTFLNSYTRRCDTFKCIEGNLNSDNKFDINVLADSGFWFTNNANKSIVCYSCNLTLLLSEYQSLDEHIDILHLSKRPTCYHMQMKYTKISATLPKHQYIRLLQFEENYSICQLCLERRVNFKLLPCNHAYSCYSCTPNLMNCPLCRSVIYSIIKY